MMGSVLVRNSKDFDFFWRNFPVSGEEDKWLKHWGEPPGRVVCYVCLKGLYPPSRTSGKL